MSILKDEVLQKKNGLLDNIIANIKAKKQIRIFLNQDVKEKYEKKLEIEKKYSSPEITDGQYDTSDLILNDYQLYKRLIIIANILKAKGLANELNVKGGFIFSTDDKVQEILERLADKIDDPNISDSALETETKLLIFATDIDERNNLNKDLDNDGVDDRLEDINNNGINDKYELDPWKHVAAYKSDVELDNMRQLEDAEYRRQCEALRKQNEKDREAEEKLHGRKGLIDILYE